MYMACIYDEYLWLTEKHCCCYFILLKKGWMCLFLHKN